MPPPSVRGEVIRGILSMDSSRQTLQTNGNFFSNFEFVFELLAKKLKNNSNK